MRFTAAIRREGPWHVAQCLEVDVASQGETEDKALENLREALALYFEGESPSADAFPPAVVRTLDLPAAS